jgi:hypothetical protein
MIFGFDLIQSMNKKYTRGMEKMETHQINNFDVVRLTRLFSKI